MAEGLLGGVLGDEDEKPDVEAPDALAGAEAFAAAVAARFSASDPEVARDTSAFLKEQTDLLRVQKEHLKDEHEARLHYLRGQAREVDIRRFGLRLRIGPRRAAWRSPCAAPGFCQEPSSTRRETSTAC
jgi:hypothetical protein